MTGDLERRLLVALLAATTPFAVGAASVLAATVDSGSLRDSADSGDSGAPPIFRTDCFPWDPSVSGECPERREGARLHDCSTETTILSAGVYADGQCCYAVEIDHHSDSCPCSGCCLGRPLLASGGPILAPAVPGPAWLDPKLAPPDLRGLADPQRERLARFWTAIATTEHGSIAGFARAALDLLAMGAPPELVDGAHRAAADETRHARQAFALASAFAGSPLQPGPIAALGGRVDVATDLATLAARTVREGILEETLSAAVLDAMRHRARDPVIARVLAGLVRDEVRHAALAWRTVRWAVEGGGTATRRAVRDAFDTVEPPGAVDDDGDELAAWGRPSERLLAEARVGARRRVVDPLVDRLVA